MVDPYAVVRRLTGHELISPKDARLLTEAVDGLIGEIGSKDARIAELEAEVERLTKEAESYRDIAARKSNQVADMIHPKALSRTGAVKPLEWVASDDWEYRWTADLYAIEDQGKNWPKDRYWLYYNGQRLGKFGTLDTALFTAQADYERRILSALTAGKPEQAVPSGWKLVPEEPTEEMYRAVYKVQDDCAIHNYGASPTFDDYWSAALSASPAAPTAGGGE